MKSFRYRIQRRASISFVFAFLLRNQSFSFPVSDTTNLVENWSFELNNQPTLQSWVADTMLRKFVQDVPSNGGQWSLQLSPGWFPQEGFARTYISGQSGGGVYQLTVWVKNMNGSRSSVRLGQWSQNAWVNFKQIPCDSSTWTQYSIVDTISLQPSDTIAVHLSAGETELVSGYVLFDLVCLEKIQSITKVVENSDLPPTHFIVNQNYPNPFNPVTIISYELPTTGFVSLKVFDLIGREVATAVNGQQAAGVYALNFDASKLASGMYFYSIRFDENEITKKMLLIK